MAIAWRHHSPKPVREVLATGSQGLRAMRNALLGAVLIAGCASVAGSRAAEADIFEGDSPAVLTLTAPFHDLFTQAKADADYHVKGQLRWSNEGSSPVTLDGVVISERGHTSRQPTECEFPKLKVDLSDVSRSGTPFEGMKTLKLGTHCGNRGDDDLTPKYGRLANERAPIREAMVYRMLRAAGIPTLLARPARVTYVDTSAPDQEPLTRFALLLEDDDEARARLEGSAQIGEEDFGSAREAFNPTDTARLAFAQAMLGNFDWCLRMFKGDIYRCDERHPLWNVLAIERKDGKTIPLPYDFDLSGPVVGRHVWFRQVFSDDFVTPPSSVRVEVEAQVQRTRSLFERSLLDETRAHFRDARSKIEDAIARSSADTRGQELAREYIDAFYDSIDTDARFYGPVVIESGHGASLVAGGSQPPCNDRSSIVPAGTPVSAPLEVAGALVRVRVLDALWEWAGENRCDAVHRQPIWIPRAAIGTAYPR